MTSYDTKTGALLYEDKEPTPKQAKLLLAYIVPMLTGKRKIRKRIEQQVGKDILYFYEKNGVTFKFEIFYGD